jgi:hypothetical protein
MSEHRLPPNTPSPSRRTVRRRVGYSVAVVVNAILLVLVNGEPGWRGLPFVTAAAEEVIFFVNLSLVVGIIVNAVNAIVDRRSVRAVGELVSSAAALVMLVRLWDVFPFAFSDASVDWVLVARTVIGFAIAGCIASMLVQSVTLIRMTVDAPESGYRPSVGRQ